MSDRIADVLDEVRAMIPTAGMHELARRALRDVIVAALLGHGEDAPIAFARLIVPPSGEGGPRTARHWASGFASDASEVALANAVSAHVLDLDDIQHPMYGHPSAVLYPALLAAGEEHDRSGPQILHAYVVGLEMASRLGRTMNLEHYRRGWHPTGVIGTLAATCAVAALLDQASGRAANSVGIAASLAAGLRANFGTMMKSVHAGMAARNGIIAVRWSEAGITANPTAVEVRHGVFETFGAEDPALLDAGSVYTAERYGLAFKRHACCGAAHAAIDAVLQLSREAPFNPNQVAHITCRVHPQSLASLVHEMATTGLEGKFSLKYCVAISLLDGAAGVSQFTDHRAGQPDVQAMQRRVTVVEDERLHGGTATLGALVTIGLHDGRSFETLVLAAKGRPQNPMSDAELQQKFDTALHGILPAERVRELSAAIDRVAELERIADLVDHLRVDDIGVLGLDQTVTGREHISRAPRIQ